MQNHPKHECHKIQRIELARNATSTFNVYSFNSNLFYNSTEFDMTILSKRPGYITSRLKQIATAKPSLMYRSCLPGEGESLLISAETLRSLVPNLEVKHSDALIKLLNSEEDSFINGSVNLLLIDLLPRDFRLSSKAPTAKCSHITVPLQAVSPSVPSSPEPSALPHRPSSATDFGRLLPSERRRPSAVAFGATLASPSARNPSPLPSISSVFSPPALSSLAKHPDWLRAVEHAMKIREQRVAAAANPRSRNTHNLTIHPHTLASASMPLRSAPLHPYRYPPTNVSAWTPSLMPPRRRSSQYGFMSGAMSAGMGREASRYHPQICVTPISSTSSGQSSDSQASAISKKQFMAMFESLYDNIDATRQMRCALDDQLRRVNTLVRSLQTTAAAIIDEVASAKRMRPETDIIGNDQEKKPRLSLDSALAQLADTLRDVEQDGAAARAFSPT